MFAQLTHQNCCACCTYSKNAIKMTIGVTEVVHMVPMHSSNTTPTDVTQLGLN